MDDQKQQILFAVIAFNIVVMIYMIYRISSAGSGGLSLGDFLIALLLGGVAAGGAFAVAMKMK
ncbi:MAG TPA: hypothetical protein VKB78_17305 [Pirellulales bacterium]|nr:hypothetical protein [Pirellulales bacterium]